MTYDDLFFQFFFFFFIMNRIYLLIIYNSTVKYKSSYIVHEILNKHKLLKYFMF